jgi:ribosomal protein S18 acetylase RimI-like enzyme
LNSVDIDYRFNTASQTDLAGHLRCVSAGFCIALSKRVDIDVYAEKLFSRAVRFEAWSGRDLVGLIAGYHTSESQTIYVTNLSVKDEFRRRGIASDLLCRMFEYGGSSDISRFELEVHAESFAALELYKSKGFSTVRILGDTVLMRKELIVSS